MSPAAKRGVGVHEALESWFATGTYGEPDEVERPYIEQAIRWAMEWNPRPLFMEPEAYALNSYAGSIDGIFEIDGEPVIVDYKTGGVFESAAMQLAAYQHADRLYPRVSEDACPIVHGGVCECEYLEMPVIERIAVLQLKPDGYSFQWLQPEAADIAWLAFEGAMSMQALKRTKGLFVPAAAKTRETAA